MRSRGPPEAPGARNAGGAEARPEASCGSTKTGGSGEQPRTAGAAGSPR